MRLVYFALAFALIASACSVNKPAPTTVSEKMDPKRPNVELQFLTRDGCKNTERMLENLNAGISNGNITAKYVLIRQENLPADDPRTGYPTPTILVNGRDIFGLPVPEQPFPEPS